EILNFSEQLLGFNWESAIIQTTPVIYGQTAFPNILTLYGFLRAWKWALPPALCAAIVVATPIARLTGSAASTILDSEIAERRRVQGDTLDLDNSLKFLLVWIIEGLPALLSLWIGATFSAEIAFRSDPGLGRILTAALVGADTPVLAGYFVVICALPLLAIVLRAPLIVYLTGSLRRDRGFLGRLSPPSPPDRGPKLTQLNILSIKRSRWKLVTNNPWPALGWLLAGGVLLVLEAGAITDVLASTLNWDLPRLPTLISRRTFPDANYRLPDGRWFGGAFGLSPFWTWFLRSILAIGYTLTILAWVWGGIRLIKTVYGDVTKPIISGPLISAMKESPRLLVGILLVCSYVSIGAFAPATAPSTADDPYEQWVDKKVTYYDEQSNEVRTVPLGFTFNDLKPNGTSNGTIGPLEYDDFGGFHPLGTTLEHKNLKEPVFPITHDLYTEWLGMLRRVLVTTVWMGAIGGMLALIALVLGKLSGRVDSILTLGTEPR
ncbi:MAG: hypothetical protein ABEI52_09945, partial [Halobacteriaceae archaeon]